MGVSSKKEKAIYQRDENLDKKVFVDRTEAIKAFEEINYELKDSLLEEQGSHATLYFWGVGGIGKSTLVDYILRDTNNNPWNNNPILNDDQIRVRYNLYTSNNQIEILYSLKKKLIKQVKDKTGIDIDFLLFDIAVAFFNEKTDAKYDYVENEDNDSKKSSIMEDLFELTSNFVAIPFKDLFDKIKSGVEGVKLIIDKVNENKIKEKYSDLIQKISIENQKEVLEDMVTCFIYDLERCTSKLKETHIEALPIIISIDTLENMEKVSDENINKDEYYSDWLLEKENGMIEQSSDVYWLLSGRNRLINTAIDDQIEIVGLQEEYIKEILNKKGIDDTDIIKAIVEVTEGLPAYIDVCVELYYKKQGNVTKEDFEGDIVKIVNRFLQNMDEKDKINLYLMSSLGIWTDEDYRNISNKTDGYLNIEMSYRELIKKSFISIDDEHRKIFHNVVRGVIYNDDSFSKERKNIYFKETLDYYKEKLNNRLSKEETLYYVDRIIFMLEEIVSDEQQLDLVIECLDEYTHRKIRNTDFSRYLDLIKQEYNCAKKYYSLDKQTQILELLARRYSFAGYNKRALEIWCDIYNNNVNMFGEKDNNTLCAKLDIARMYINIGESTKGLQLADEIYTQIINNQFNDNNQELIGRLFRLYERHRDYDKAIKLTEIKIENIINDSGEYSYEAISEKTRLAGLYSNNNENEKANRIIIDAENSIDNNDELDEEHLKDIRNKIERYRVKENPDKAIEQLKKQYEDIKDKKGEDNFETLEALIKIIDFYQYYDQDDKTEELLDKALEWYKDSEYGTYFNYSFNLSKIVRYYRTINPDKSIFASRLLYEKAREATGVQSYDTIRALVKLGSTHYSIENNIEAHQTYKKALETVKTNDTLDNKQKISLLDRIDIPEAIQEIINLYEKMYKNSIEEYGEYSIKTRSILSETARYYKHIKDYDNSLKVYQRLFEQCKDTFGKQHRETLDVMEAMSGLYKELGKYDKCIELLSELYEIRKENLGENNIETIHCLFNLASIYEKKGNNDKALELFEILVHKENRFKEKAINHIKLLTEKEQ